MKCTITCSYRDSLCWQIWSHQLMSKVPLFLLCILNIVCSWPALHMFSCSSHWCHQGSCGLTWWPVDSKGTWLYARAVLAWASGSLPKAAEGWCTMLIEIPWVNNKYLNPDRRHFTPNADVLEICVMVGSFIVLGEFKCMRDMLASALAHWNEDTKLYHYSLGLWAHDCHMIPLSFAYNCYSYIRSYGYALEECREWYVREGR